MAQTCVITDEFARMLVTDFCCFCARAVVPNEPASKKIQTQTTNLYAEITDRILARFILRVVILRTDPYATTNNTTAHGRG